jgi:hypothetical protein
MTSRSVHRITGDAFVVFHPAAELKKPSHSAYQSELRAVPAFDLAVCGGLLPRTRKWLTLAQATIRGVLGLEPDVLKAQNAQAARCLLFLNSAW